MLTVNTALQSCLYISNRLRNTQLKCTRVDFLKRCVAKLCSRGLNIGDCMDYRDKRIYMLTKFMHPEVHWIVSHDYNHNIIKCSCNIFNGIGILCSHAFYVMRQENLRAMPESLIRNRWRKHVMCVHCSQLFSQVCELH